MELGLAIGVLAALFGLVAYLQRDIRPDDRDTPPDGPIDTGVTERIGGELLATLREALSNVARHAGASRVEVEVLVGGEVCVRVTDDGIGPPTEDGPRGHGLANMAARAAQLGGSLELEAGPQGGTVLTWQVPKG